MDGKSQVIKWTLKCKLILNPIFVIKRRSLCTKSGKVVVSQQKKYDKFSGNRINNFTIDFWYNYSGVELKNELLYLELIRFFVVRKLNFCDRISYFFSRVYNIFCTRAKSSYCQLKKKKNFGFRKNENIVSGSSFLIL